MTVSHIKFHMFYHNGLTQKDKIFNLFSNQSLWYIIIRFLTLQTTVGSTDSSSSPWFIPCLATSWEKTSPTLAFMFRKWTIRNVSHQIFNQNMFLQGRYINDIFIAIVRLCSFSLYHNTDCFVVDGGDRIKCHHLDERDKYQWENKPNKRYNWSVVNFLEKWLPVFIAPMDSTTKSNCIRN